MAVHREVQLFFYLIDHSIPPPRSWHGLLDKWIGRDCFFVKGFLQN